MTRLGLGFTLILFGVQAFNGAHGVEKGDEAPFLWVYVGTYTEGKSKSQGIYRCELDLTTGKLKNRGLAIETASPSFLAIHPKRKHLYAVGEAGGKKNGVSAFAIDEKTGKLTLLNQKSSEGAGPCHLVLDREGKHVLVANYGGGNVAVLPIEPDGKLRDASCVIQHEGKGTDPKRQDKPHAHSINLDREGRFAYAADLGLDKVLIYRYDATAGKLAPADPAFAATAPAAGPRHFTFLPDGKFAFVINELANTITVFEHNPKTGALKEIQTIGTLPADFMGTNFTAEVVAHPSGRFLYGSNRGHDSIAVFTVDEMTGMLAAAGHVPTGGKWPRHFNVDPTGKFLLVANQQSDNVTVFAIDPATGGLKATESSVEIGQPACVQFLFAP
jgi:6-phosphogluconolactonase